MQFEATKAKPFQRPRLYFNERFRILLASFTGMKNEIDYYELRLNNVHQPIKAEKKKQIHRELSLEGMKCRFKNFSFFLKTLQYFFHPSSIY